MSLSLPVDPPRARSLTGVVPQMIAALSGGSDWFAPATSAIVLLVDGLGAQNLAARAGHARFLSGASSKKDTARTVFPSTTATALTGLLTGAPAGRHGILGYRALVPERDEVINQLRGWDTDGLPISWQRAQPLLEREAGAGRPCFIVSKPEYAGTGFTAATMRGAEFHGAADLADRFGLAAHLSAQHPGSLIYLYANELDAIGHKHGWESERWTHALERIDGAVRTLAGALPADVGVVVTADHGMVDVPRHRQLLLTDGDELVDGVRHIGGEPRMLHLYAEDGQAAAVLAAWRAAESGRSWVLSRDEAISAGLFGDVDAAVAPRIGDVLVAARAGIAYYDDRLTDKAPQKMVGQHGSLTNEERVVPLIRLGAFA
ncbi:alkaline phosphatase family protein [Microbacterium terricola]|uniref:Alkaline phosphatase family protein n=1 Tax=Microbacterium terricola TaxID=344163 RepID=A0ABM8DYP3_9MICO|nr:nucleotide pyrophosphatase/phosphodiesterase family protein [Microbacterium terricola]UYK38661.1 alkaline phosphatase family protein [Microbacterium terricola]BDV30651.1 alkaline phosphatase family protein [Microbacterium terricola]